MIWIPIGNNNFVNADNIIGIQDAGDGSPVKLFLGMNPSTGLPISFVVSSDNVPQVRLLLGYRTDTTEFTTMRPKPPVPILGGDPNG